ncbi:MAG: tRNA-dihydrouridine synthase family protein [Pseudomonadota bacterium]
MKVLLAPMEGVIDHHMRETLTGVGGYDGCVTEFMRITDQLQPSRVFKRLLPELDHQGKTSSGVPVTLQLLGGDAGAMAANAQRAAQLGAPAIDINFGCPSKLVTSKNGGSALLREPEQVHAIVAAVCQAVDSAIPVTAKMRLGYEDDALALDNALAIESAGAAELTVHARTKLEGYTPPARWEALAPLREALSITLIANGDIRSPDDYQRCVEASGCEDVMLGRGAISNPSLARQIKQRQHGGNNEPMAWCEIARLIIEGSERMSREYREKYVVMRIKQWLRMLRGDHIQGQRAFEKIRLLKKLSEIKMVLSD